MACGECESSLTVCVPKENFLREIDTSLDGRLPRAQAFTSTVQSSVPKTHLNRFFRPTFHKRARAQPTEVRIYKVKIECLQPPKLTLEFTPERPKN